MNTSSEWINNILAHVRNFDKLPLQVKYAKALELRNYRLMEVRGRYVIYSKEQSMTLVYVGLSGSVRIGSTRGNSRPIIDEKKKQLLAEFDNWVFEQKVRKAIPDTDVPMIEL